MRIVRQAANRMTSWVMKVAHYCYECLTRRPYSAMIFLGSIGLLVMIPMVVYTYYSVRPPNGAFVEVKSPRGDSIGDVRVQAEYVPSSADRLAVSVWFEKVIPATTADSLESDLILTIPRSFTPTRKSTHLTCLKLTNQVPFKDVRWLYYRVVPNCGAVPGLTQGLRGNLFHASAYDIWMDLQVDTRPKTIPAELLVLGLSGVSLERVSPKPTERLGNILHYVWPGGARTDDVFRGRCVVRGTDREIASKFGVILFGSGIICGLLGSIVANMILGVVRHIEER